MYLVTWSNKEYEFKLDANKVQHKYNSLLESLNNKGVTYWPSGIQKNNLIGSPTKLIEFTTQFNVKAESSELEEVLKNEQSIQKYSNIVDQKIQKGISKLLEDDKLNSDPFAQEIIKKIQNKDSIEYQREYERNFDQTIKKEIKEGKFTVTYNITPPTLKVLKEKFRYLATEFCEEFEKEFGLKPEITN